MSDWLKAFAALVVILTAIGAGIGLMLWFASLPVVVGVPLGIVFIAAVLASAMVLLR